MCRKLINLVSFVLVLGLVLTSAAGAADPDLIGWWPLNEGSGDVAIDLSASGNDGTIRNADSGGLGDGGSVWVNDPERGMVISFNGDDGTGAVVSTDLIIPASTLDSDFTWAFWAKQHADQATNNDTILGNRYGGTTSPLQFIKFTPTRFEHYNDDGSYSEGINYNSIPLDVWVHHVISKDGPNLTYYRNGVESGTNTISKTIDENPFGFGGDPINNVELWRGYMSDVRLYTKALTLNEVLGVMEGIGEVWPYASSAKPADGSLHADTWVNISWRPGGHAVSHDVYLGDNFDDVNSGAGDTFRGNQADTFFVAGFPGFPYPDGLVPGTTYYWRIDEVNDTEPNSPWKGDVWSFSIPPKTAYFPDPADAAELVDTGVQLKWTGGFGSKLHTVYFGDNFDEVNNAAGGLPQGTATYNPGPLKTGKTYYWRVDEFDIIDTYKGHVWSFTTEGAVVSLKPSNGAMDVKQTQILTWSPGEAAASHEVYFGTDKEVVRDADTSSPEYKGTRDLGSESYDPGMLEWDSNYYWRVDEVNNANPDSPWVGPVWSFTTANFLIVDDFESYNDLDPTDPDSNRIFFAWIDGYEDPANGSLVGYEMPPFAEQTIVHSGSQSMPLFYDNSVGYSEATLTLTYPRDWTEKGVTTLTIWFRGISDNAAETLYVALNGSAVVSHDNPDAAQINEWTQWNIDLQAFADQGVNLADVNTIALGLGDRNNPAAGGSGTMYFDDIRLYLSAP
jgi:hypothetical protein